METVALLRAILVYAPVCALSCYLSFPVGTLHHTYKAYQQYLTDELFPPFIGCNMFVNLCEWVTYLVSFQLPRSNWSFKLPSWPTNIQIYFGACFNVMACYMSLLRINLSYLWVSPFPLIAISFVMVLCIKLGGQYSEGADKAKSQQALAVSQAHLANSTETVQESMDSARSLHGQTLDNATPNIHCPDCDSGLAPTRSEGVSIDDGKKARVIPKKFERLAIVPHMVLCAFGMIGDTDHDGYDYDMSQFLLFLTSTLAALTLMMMRLPAGLSRGIAPASQLLCKASLLMLLVTVHMVAADAFGKDVVRFLLPEVVPVLLWYSVHLDRRSPIIDVTRIFDWEPFVYKAMAVTVFVCILLSADESTLLVSLYRAIASFAISALMMYAYLLVLRMWPEKVGTATLSFDEAVMLLKFWGSILLKVAVAMSTLGGLVYTLRWHPTFVLSWVAVFLMFKLLGAVVPLFRSKKTSRGSRESNFRK